MGYDPRSIRNQIAEIGTLVANTSEQNSVHECDFPAAKAEAERIRMSLREVLPLSREESDFLLKLRARTSRRNSPLRALLSRLLIGAVAVIGGGAVLLYVQLIRFQAAGLKGEPPYLLSSFLKLMGGE